MNTIDFPDQKFWKKNNETENIWHLYERAPANNICDFLVSPSKFLKLKNC